VSFYSLAIKLTQCLVALSLLPGLLVAQAGSRQPYESTYKPMAVDDFVITGANVYTGSGEFFENTDVVVRQGRIAAIGGRSDEMSMDAISMDGLRQVDGAGMWLSPGLIDVHSHLGTYPSPAISSTQDGNEMTSPNTARVWVEHSVWPQDPQFDLALAGGVTTLQILPGSGNLFGGRGVTLKNVPARTVQEMKFPGAKHSLKMACGENPKRVYGGKSLAPSTRMGNVAGYREAWAKAQAYQRKWAAYREDDSKPQPDRDLGLETLVGVLEGEIIVHNHCYRADEMAYMIDIAQEFGYRIGTFHHAIEAYKVADLLAQEGICSAMWADWWGVKLELFDGVQQNVALVHQAKACAIVHSDSALGIQRLNQEASKALTSARRMGMNISKAEAMQWITLNAATALGMGEETGSIEVGKAADIVLWDDDPFSVYAHAQKVFIDGHLYYDKQDATRQPRSDFELGQTVGGLR